MHRLLCADACSLSATSLVGNIICKRTVNNELKSSSLIVATIHVCVFQFVWLFESLCFVCLSAFVSLLCVQMCKVLLYSSPSYASRVVRSFWC